MLDRKLNIYIAGHTGMVGSALLRCLRGHGHERFVLRDRSELDLLNPIAVNDFFKDTKIDFVILAAAKVGGIQANINFPVEFLYDNLTIQNNVLSAALKYHAKKVIFLASSCIYPRDCPQPMSERYLLNGQLEPTNEGYAIAKIAGIKLLEYMNREYGLSGFSALPCNLYGPNDSFDLQHSHVLSALVRRFVEADALQQKEITLWGTGNSRREFLHVDDLAEAIYIMMDTYKENDLINVGSGFDVSIKELAEMVAAEVGFKGTIGWDTSKPDGMPRKCLDVSKIRALGFIPKIDLKTGIRMMLNQYLEQVRGANP